MGENELESLSLVETFRAFHLWASAAAYLGLAAGISAGFDRIRD